MENTEVICLFEGHISLASENDGLKMYTIHPWGEVQDAESGSQVFTFGHPSDCPTKCVLLLGETGTGKTTFVNAVINFLFGVKFQDDFRLQVAEQSTTDDRLETESQTDLITVYTFYHQEGMNYKYNFVLIDTPGLGDTRGSQYQENTLNHLEAFLMSDFGVDDLNCIGLVVKSDTSRDFSYQKDLLEKINLLLGSSVPQVTQLLATYGVDSTVVDQVVRNAGVAFREMFQFDHGVLFGPHGNSTSVSQNKISMASLRWDNMFKQVGTFITALINALPSVSVKILREQKFLDKAKETLKTHIEDIASLIMAMENDKRKFIKYELREASSKGWRKEETTMEKVRVRVGPKVHAHNCYICEQTCIYPCPPRGASNEDNVIVGLSGLLGGTAAAAVTRVATSGKIVPSVVGAVVGFVIGLTSGDIVEKIAESSCRVSAQGDVCGEKGCIHSLSNHAKQQHVIVEKKQEVEKIDEKMKELHDEAVSKKEDIMLKIESGSLKITNCKKKIAQSTVQLVYHAKKVQEMTHDPVSYLDLVLQLMNEARLFQPNLVQPAIEHLHILKGAVRSLAQCATNEILEKSELVEEMLVHAYNVEVH